MKYNITNKIALGINDMNKYIIGIHPDSDDLDQKIITPVQIITDDVIKNISGFKTLFSLESLSLLYLEK